MYSKGSCPSYMKRAFEDPFYDLQDIDDLSLSQKDHPEYNLKRMVYKYTSSLSFHLDYGTLDGWRVHPSPKLSEDTRENIVSLIGFIVNPYGKQKELAKAYLEAITEQPVGVYSGYYYPFIFKDMNSYEGAYDITLPAVKDIYEIFKNGKQNTPSYPYDWAIVDDYQQGRLTLEEAIERVQRETEMWLNE